MDENTRRELARIQARVPEHLKKGLLRREIDSEQFDRAKDVLSSKHATSQEKQHVQRMIDSGAIRVHTEDVIDDKIAKEIDNYHEKAIAHARQQGKLADPNDDPFIRRRKI